MGRVNFRAIAFVAVLIAIVFGLNLLTAAQEKPKPNPSDPPTQSEKEPQKEKTDKQKDKTKQTDMQHPHDKDQMKQPATGTATLTANLVDPDTKSAKKEATVQVTVSGLQIVDPASVGEQAKAGQGHIHYQVDDGPIIATTSTKLSFHGLTSGTHKILITLAANDHSPIGQPQTLTVTIP